MIVYSLNFKTFHFWPITNRFILSEKNYIKKTENQIFWFDSKIQ